MKKTIYEVPYTRILSVSVAGRILDSSVNSVMGPAKISNWDSDEVESW